MGFFRKNKVDKEYPFKKIMELIQGKYKEGYVIISLHNGLYKLQKESAERIVIHKKDLDERKEIKNVLSNKGKLKNINNHVNYNDYKSAKKYNESQFAR